MLRVLFLNRDLEYHGGVSNALLNLVQGHDAARMDLRIATMMAPSAAMQSALRESEIDPHCVGDRGYLRPAAAVRRLLRDEGIEVVVACSFKSTLVAKAASVGLDCRVVHYLHSVDHVIEGELKRRIFTRLARDDAMLFVSRAVEQAHRPAGHRGRAAVIYNGVRDPFADPATRPYERSFRATLGIPDDALLLCYIGAFVPCKDHGTLLRAFERLDPAFNAHLMLIGKCEPGSTVERQIAAMKNSGKVHLVAPRPDARQVLGAADIYVHPGREGFGLAVVEAMLAGRPVVVVREGALVEFVEDGITGLFAEPQDPDSFANRIEAIARDPALARSLAQAGREASLARFAVREFADSICDFLEEVRGAGRAQVAAR